MVRVRRSASADLNLIPGVSGWLRYVAKRGKSDYDDDDDDDDDDETDRTAATAAAARKRRTTTPTSTAHRRESRRRRRRKRSYPPSSRCLTAGSRTLRGGHRVERRAPTRIASRRRPDRWRGCRLLSLLRAPAARSHPSFFRYTSPAGWWRASPCPSIAPGLECASAGASSALCITSPCHSRCYLRERCKSCLTAPSARGRGGKARS